MDRELPREGHCLGAIRWNCKVHFLEVIPGKGVLDYATYLKRLAALPWRRAICMLEHLKTAEEY